VDEEVRRLPAEYRLPIILCGLEGRSLEDAARQLGWTAARSRAGWSAAGPDCTTGWCAAA